MTRQAKNSPPTDRSKATEQWTFVVLIGCVLAEILWLCVAGYPLASHDDLWWLGPAESVARTGSLQHPLYVDAFCQALGVDSFFAQGPVFFYVFGGWLAVFGTSAVTVICFHWVCIGFAAAAFVWFASQFRLPRFVVVLGVMLLIFQFATTLRPEALMLAFGFAACRCLLATPNRRNAFAGMLCSVLSVMTYPQMAAVLLPVGVLSASRFFRRAAHDRPVAISYALASVSGIVGGVAISHIMLRGAWPEFFSALLATRRLRASAIGDAPARLLGLLTQGWEWLLTAPFVIFFASMIIVVLLNRRRFPRELQAFAVVAVGSTILSIFLYVENAVRLIQLFGWCLGLAVASYLLSVRHWTAIALLSVLWLAFSRTMQVAAWWGQKPLIGAEASRVAARNALSAGKRLVIDGPAARFLFDYQLPPETQSLFFGVPNRVGPRFPPSLYPSDASWKLPNEVWVFAQSSAIANSGPPITGLPAAVYLPPPRVNIAGISFRSLPTEPYRFFVVE